MQNQIYSNYSNNLLFVLSILECIEKLTIYSEGFDSSEHFFESDDQQAYNASCHLLLAIGEETKKIDSSLKDEISFIEWNQITSLRNRIAHDYRGIDPDIVFSILKNELGILKLALNQLLKIIQPDQILLEQYVNTKYFKHLSYLL
jgi:uncharacterized protein with HEPN domain